VAGRRGHAATTGGSSPYLADAAHSMQPFRKRLR
jgi:hypothetical protein